VTLDPRTKRFLVLGFLVAVVVAVVISQFASSSPDGLEFVAGREGFADTVTPHAVDGSPLADYGSGLFDGGAVGTAVAGLIGVVATFAVGYGLLRLSRRRKPKAQA
jgi:hypothetical protein